MRFRPSAPSLKVQILLPLALYLAVWAGYATLLQTTLGWGPGTIFGFFCALVAMVLLGLVVAIWRSRRSEQLLEQTRHRAPRQSSFVVFQGRLEAARAPVEAPLSGKPCVAWEYEFETSVLYASGKVAADSPLEWFGIGQVALQVAMPYAKIPIRAGALMEDSEQERVPRTVGVERAQRLVGLPDLRVVSGAADFGSLLGGLDELMADDGDSRLDYVRGPWSPAVPIGKPKRMREKSIEPGCAVTVQGLYDSPSGTIVASRHGVLVNTARESYAGQEGATPSSSGIGVVLVVLAINLVVHALVILALFRPPEF